jgi:hypothetical protein
MWTNGTPAPPSSPAEIAVMPLGTTASHRILAWPRYDSSADLLALAHQFGPVLAQHKDVCLCLRHEATDLPLDTAISLLNTAFTATLGAGFDLQVLVVDDALDEAGWRALGRAITGVLALPSWADADRHTRLGSLGHPPIRSAEELRRRLLGQPETPVAVTPTRPAVSVILPTFNRPDFLARALDSLTAQTFRDFEVVVVNDGGAGVEAVLQRFAPALSITYVRHDGNRAPAAARNSGLAIARGTYVAYLDDDDCYRPDHLDVLVTALRRGSQRVAYTDASWILEEKTATGYGPVRPILERSVAFDRERLMIASYIPLLSVMHERACLDEAGVFDEALGTHEDWDLLIRLAARFEFLHLAQVTADISWREDGSSATSAQAPDFRRTMLTIHQRYRHLIEDKPQVLAGQARLTGATSAPARDAATEVVEQARAQMSRGDLNGASRTLSASMDLAPQSADLLLTLADVFTAQRKPEVADQVLQQAALLHPLNQAIRARLQPARR